MKEHYFGQKKKWPKKVSLRCQAKDEKKRHLMRNVPKRKKQKKENVYL